MSEVTSRPITMAQVAQHAGVSQASVSRVLNGVATVDPAIVAKVNRAVAALNYSPSEAARSLVRGSSHTIALLVPDLENPMFQGVLKGLTVAAARDRTPHHFGPAPSSLWARGPRTARTRPPRRLRWRRRRAPAAFRR